jgi:hypothetical protein
MVDFADRARRRLQGIEDNATLNSSRVNFRQNFIRQNNIHHFLLGGRGVSFGTPFDGVGLPSHNVTIMTINDNGEVPMAVINIGYKQNNTFPKMLDVSLLNNIQVIDNEVIITMPKNEEGMANATGMYYGLNSAFSQHGKIFSAVPLRLLVSYHISSNSTSSAFKVKSKYGKTRLLKESMTNESEFVKEFNIGANGIVDLGELTQALVKIPDVAEVDPQTGLAMHPQYLITDRVTIKLIRK